MVNPWFRLYAEFMHDPKVQRMEEKHQRRLVMIFCMRCNGHVTLQCNDVTFMLRISDAEWQESRAIFIAHNFIDSDGKVLNWDKRQFVSDSSSARVAKHRALHKSVTVTPCNVTVTPPDTDTDTEQKKTLVASKADNCPHEKIIALYHEVLPELPGIKVWTDKRKASLKARWLEDEKRQNLDYWRKFFVYVSKSDYLMGKVNGFQATLEWLVNSTNFPKVIEGNYENRKAT